MNTTEKRKFFTKISKKVGKAIFDYEMIKEGDKVLVGVSGGKDSLTLIDILTQKQKSSPIKFSLEVVHIDFGFCDQQSCISGLEIYLKSYGLNLHMIQKPLPETKDKINCFWCSWNRRKEIFLLAGRLGCTKVALGHNQDDIVTTFLMNLFYHGEISTMTPNLSMFKGEFNIIRPLAYVTEEETKKYAQLKNLPVKNCSCPYFNNEHQFSYRKYIREFINELEKHNKFVKINVFNRMKKIKQNYLV
jgi:tRNA 2-thiocytidine biosynthesis protein TtcA